MTIRDLLKKQVIICDGAMGTMIQRSGLPVGKHPEILNFTHPEEIKDIYRQYYEAGSDFVTTNTFGANAFKLWDCEYTVGQVIFQAVKVAREAAEEAEKKLARPCLVALDVAPIGRLMEPTGDLSFEEAVSLFGEQMAAGVQAGADFIVCETFTDIYELKAAIIAAKERASLPLFCSVSFQEDGKMLMGTDPKTAVCYLQDLGMDALGVNCSLGPKQMVPIVREFLKYARIPVLVQPNAGLPRMVDGETVFDVTVEEYADVMAELVGEGVAVAGGCCGTSPEYIEAIAQRIRGKQRVVPAAIAEGGAPSMTVCSSTKTVVVGGGSITIVGERLNPTGKKALKEALKTGNYNYAEDEAIAQVKAGAEILDLNVGLPELDEKKTMLEMVKRISQVVEVPLQIDSANPEVLEAAVRSYNGKPILNSVNGKKESLEQILPIAKKYGANVIALTLDENGLPKNKEERLAIAKRIIEKAAEYGMGQERILVDCLALTVSAEQSAAQETLSAIRALKQSYNVKTTLGASNISFGLPNRKLLNSTFLTMAMAAGLDAPITDPLVSDYADVISAYEALSGADKECEGFVKKYGRQEEKPLIRSVGQVTLNLHDMIVKGYANRAKEAATELLKQKKPLEIVEEIIIPALEIVGKDYETGRSFLPQLMKSADTVREAFCVLKEAMSRDGEEICYGKIILATVEGDIHDIGKNIVKVLLENYGYEIIDLGKDVPTSAVVEAAKAESIQLVGLSALMTTTVVSMEKTIQELRKAGISCKVAVGGAVLNEEYAEKIGADYYCREAMDTVKVANRLFKEEKVGGKTE